MESFSSLELLSRAALNVQEHEAALELSKLPAKKKLLSQLKQQQNAIQNQSAPPIGTVNQAHSTTNSINSNIREPEPMEQDDEEINVNDDDDSPLDMRITKHDSDSDSVRPSVIRRAPSFKETTPNSPSRDPTSTCDPVIDEHFRRSLGTDYDLIMRNKQEQELALQKQRMMEEQQLLLQQQQEAATIQAQQQQNILKLKHHKKHQIHQHHQAMLAAKQAIATPPTTPSPPNQAQTAPPPQKQVIITEHSNADEMSVDDHFAKALGDTWKQFQNDGK